MLKKISKIMENTLKASTAVFAAALFMYLYYGHDESLRKLKLLSDCVFNNKSNKEIEQASIAFANSLEGAVTKKNTASQMAKNAAYAAYSLGYTVVKGVFYIIGTLWLSLELEVQRHA